MAVDTIQWQIGKNSAPLPPLAKGLPFLGSALHMRKDTVRYLVDCYHELGPIFRVRILQREVTFLAGIEANRFAARDGAAILSNYEAFIGEALALGSEQNMVILDGEEHRFHRTLSRDGFSRTQILGSLPALVEETQNFVARLPLHGSFEVFRGCQRLITSQLSRVAAGFLIDDYFNDLLVFQRYMMHVNLVKSMPKFVLKFPHYKKAQARTHELARKVVAFHQANPPGESRPRDLIDDLLQAHHDHPDRMSLEGVYSAAIGPYIAGQDTVASSVASILYAILKHPEILERVQPEVDALFANGIPQPESLRSAENLYKTVIEGLRRYPAAPFMMYQSKQDFEFGGYRVPAESSVYVPQVLTHFLPEYYPDPYRFDIDRPKPAAGAFAPYGVGPHTCLGAGMAEVQIMMTIAGLLHFLDLALDPPTYDLTLGMMPVPHPKGFKVKVLGKRQN